MLGQRLRHWPSIISPLGERLGSVRYGIQTPECHIRAVKAIIYLRYKET